MPKTKPAPGFHIENRDLIETAWMRIVQIQEHISSIAAAQNCLRSVGKTWSSAKVPGDDIVSALYEAELNCWRDLFMFGLTVRDDLRDRVKAAAHARFLSERMSVSEYLHPESRNPGTWLVAEEDEFREMARVMFAPKERGGDGA